MRAFLLAGALCVGQHAFAAPAACRYDVDVSPAFVLEVTVECGAAATGFSGADRHAAGHLTVESAVRGGQGFSGRYRVNLGSMAREHATVDAALAIGDSIVAVASTWLLAPIGVNARDSMLEVRVSMPPGLDFVTAQPMVDGAFRIAVTELRLAGYSAFGRLRRRPAMTPAFGASSPAAEYEVVLLDGRVELGEAVLLDWVARSADIMTRFWRGFPAPGLKIFVLPRAGAAGVLFGRDMSGGGISTVLIIGEHTTRAQLADDWILIHELLHVGTPLVKGAPWFTEGLATYFEPLLRARYALQTPAALWTEFTGQMPRGAAAFRDAGLARAGFRGWYWGGGLLMLLADLEIRRASGGGKGLEDCLRAVQVDLGNYLRTVSLDEMVGACDRALGGGTLARLVQRHAMAATPVDLDQLWRDLGVRRVGDGVEFVPDAPLAALRESMVRGGPVASVE